MISEVMRTAFIIAPAGADPEFQRKSVILLEIANNNNWKLRLPQYDAKRPVFDINETLDALTHTDLVVADLSYERPSCYFELGLAEALRRPTVIVAASNTDIHQTSLRNEVRYYSNNEEFRVTIDEVFTG